MRFVLAGSVALTLEINKHMGFNAIVAEVMLTKFKSLSSIQLAMRNRAFSSRLA